MPFSTFETSAQNANVIELYEFGISGLRHYFTSSAQNYTYSSRTWTAGAIGRSAFSVNTSNDRANIKIAVKRDNPVADLFRVSPPAFPVTVTIRRLHITDNDARIFWFGRVLGCEWQGLEAILNCEPITASMERNCLRRKTGKNCPHMLYGNKCGLNKITYANSAVLSSVVGVQLNATAFSVLPSGILSGGLFEWTNPDGLIEPRMIASHTGGNITISYPIDKLTSGQNVTVYRGCNHTLGAGGCADFANTDNYGGQPFLPSKNPFGGDPIY